MDIIVQGDLGSWPDEIKRKFKKLLLRATLHVESLTVEEAPRVSGNLVNTVSSHLEGMRGIVNITAKYARFVVEGTGIYGPRGRRIMPKTKQALAFTYKGIPMVRRSVAGSKPDPFHERAADRALPKVAAILQQV